MSTNCQCAAHPGVPCEYAITQEDLRCDHCRAGCDLLTLCGLPDGQHAVHVNKTGELDVTDRFQQLVNLAAAD